MSDWITRHRAAVYLVLNIGLALAAVASAAARDIPVGRVIYTWVLFALCSAPLLYLRALNSRYVLLGFFMAPYFLCFGALDLSAVLFGEDSAPLRNGFITPAEIAILSGAALVMFGYLRGVKLFGGAAEQAPATEWPERLMLLLGVAIWVAGTAAIIYFQVFVMPAKTGESARHGIADLGPFLTFIVMLGALAQPLGLLILAYGYARHRNLLWEILILAIVAAQTVVGFVTDIKSIAMIAGVVIIMTRTLVNNRLPLFWIAGGLLFASLAFPVFQAYRAEVAGERGLDRGQALAQLGKVVAIAFASRDKVTSGEAGQRSQTFVERASSKESLELLIARVGDDVPYLNGASLVALPMAFVPRLIAPDKEDVAVGQLFNRRILRNDNDTYISISHLGELYWNFGWPGILVGMPLIGLLLGFVGAKTSLEHGASLTRVMVLVGTAQTLCLGFGGGLPVSYIVWLRSLVAIGVLHLLFARRTRTDRAQDARAVRTTGSSPATLTVDQWSVTRMTCDARFPNLLR